MPSGGRILFVGVNTTYDYGEMFFSDCVFETLDIRPTTNPTHTGDIRFCPLPDSSYDGIILIGVYEFLDGGGNVFTEMNRMLKPGGRALICVPSIGFYSDRIKYLMPGEVYDRLLPLKLLEMVVTYYRDTPYYIHTICRKGANENM